MSQIPDAVRPPGLLDQLWDLIQGKDDRVPLSNIPGAGESLPLTPGEGRIVKLLTTKNETNAQRPLRQHDAMLYIYAMRIAEHLHRSSVPGTTSLAESVAATASRFKSDASRAPDAAITGDERQTLQAYLAALKQLNFPVPSDPRHPHPAQYAPSATTF